MTPLNLTFGCELEFIAVYPEGMTWPSPPYSEDVDGGAGAAIYWALRRAGIPVTGWEPESEGFQDDIEPYTRWSVREDSLRLSRAEEQALPTGYKPESIELVSPIFRFGVDDWQTQICNILNVLARFEAQTGCRLITNTSTGLHVHVGNGKQKMPLQMTKRILQIMTAFERCFDELHPANRICMPKDYCLHFNHAPLSFFHRFNGANNAGAGLFDWLASIEEARSYEGLGKLFRLPDSHILFPGINEKTDYCHNSVLNVENLYADESSDRYEEDLKGTVEFRQHTGTLDFVSIAAWTSLVLSIAQYCAEKSEMEFLALCAHGVDTDITLPDLLSAIGCHPDVTAHYLGEGALATNTVINRAELPISGSVAKLLAVNEAEQAEQRADALLKAAKDDKMYGLDPAVRVVHVPADGLPRYYQAFCADVQRHGVPSEGEEVFRTARVAMLRHFGNLYRGTTVDPEYMRASGECVTFGRCEDEMGLM